MPAECCSLRFLYFVFLLASILTWLPAVGWCESTSPERVQLVHAAVERDARLVQARTRIEASTARIDAASAAYFPSLSLTTRANHNDRWGSAAQISSDEDRGRVYSLRMTWNLFQSGGDVSRVAAATEDKSAAQIMLRQTRLETLGELMESLLDYRKYEALILSAAHYRDQTRDFARRLERSIGLGQTAALEVERALARNGDGALHHNEFIALRDAKAVVLQQKFGLFPNEILPPLSTLSTLLSATPHATDPSSCDLIRPVNMPTIARLEAELSARQHQLDVARSQYGPRIDLQVTRNAGRHFYKDLSGKLSEKRVEIMLSIPLLDGGHTNAQVREAIAMRAQAQAALYIARSDSNVEGQKNCIRWKASMFSAINAAQAFHRTEKIMAGLDRERQFGFKNSFDLLDASRDQFLVARQFVEQTYESRRMAIQRQLLDASGADDSQYVQLIATALKSL